MLISKQQYAKVLDEAGLSFLPEAYNLDDGLVERSRQAMQMAHPNLDNVSWLSLAVVEVSRGYAAEHPVFKENQVAQATERLAAEMHEQIHGSPLPEYKDASDPAAAAAERADALAQKAVKDAADALAKVAEVKQDSIPGEKISDGLPSAEDLDAVAEEEKLKNAPTSNVQ